MASELANALPDPNRLRAFQPCVDDYGVSDPTDPWANNCLANDAVAYSNGLITRLGTAADLRYDPEELVLCRAIAEEAARVMGPRWPGMYSASDSRTEPYFAVSAAFVPRSVPDPDLVRSVFGEALYPETRVTVEALDESGEWWRQVQQCAVECEEDDPDFDANTEVISPWRSVIRWFAEHPGLRGSCFIQIRKTRRGIRGGCVFPWFVVGLTKRGSIAGISTCLVQS